MPGPNKNFGDINADKVGSETNPQTAQVDNLNDVEHLSNADSGKSNVDDYLNNNLSEGETVVIDPGTHTVSEITTTVGADIIWRGVLVPDGDHPVITHDPASPAFLTIHPQGEVNHIDTSSVGTYTSDAFVTHGRIRSYGIVGVKATGRIAVYFHQNDVGANLNHSDAQFRLDGNSAGDYGLVVDNTTGGGSDLNDMHIICREIRTFQEYGAYLNAGVGNKYELSCDENNVPTGWYAGDDGSPPAFIASGTTHSDLDAWVRSDGNNTANDEISTGVNRSIFRGFLNGTPSELADTSTYQQGNIFNARNSASGVAINFDNESANDATESVKAQFRGAGETVLGSIEALGNGVMVFPSSNDGRWQMKGDLQIHPNGTIFWNAEDLTSRSGSNDGEMAKHDGTGTPGEGFYEWDSGDATWYGIGRVQGTTI